MFNSTRPAARDLDPRQVHQAVVRGEMVLVDVREPAEYRAERIAGAVNQPLSSFDPKALPDAAGKTIVLHCAGGVRSAKALEQCRRAGIAVTQHLAGGLNAWKAAGLPVVR